MLRLRQEKSRQISIVDQLLPASVVQLPEDLSKLDKWLDDERFFTPFKKKYHQWLGRPSIPAETYLRITALKHQYNLSDRFVCTLVNDRISWRKFCRIPWDEPVPHPSSLTKIRKRLDADGSDHMELLNAHLVRKAQEEGLLKGNKIRVDTTVVESNIHHPTDAGLIADTVRMVTRLAKEVQSASGQVETVIRDRTRSIKKRVLKIAKVLRRRTGEAVREVRQITAEMADIAGKTIRSAHDLLQKLENHPPKAARLKEILELGEQIIQQTHQVNAGQSTLPDRLISLCDPDARPIRRGKLHKQNEFGYKLRVTENKERIITEYRLFKGNPSDKVLLKGSLTNHSKHTGRPPKQVAADRGFWALENELALKEMGVNQASLPFRGKHNPLRTQHERQPWFRRLQRWRAGQEGTISVLKRRYGLGRSLYRGLDGSQCWVGGAIWGYNLNRIAQLV